MNYRLTKPQYITNSVMAYQWGVRDGISSRLQLDPTGEAEAEIWIGAHPKAPSRFRDGTSLKDYEKASGEQLPYLLKMLAVNEALSIQAHPTAARAQAGFAAENASQVPITAASRNYRDPNPKPELIVALETGFAALCGFRDINAANELLTVLAAGRYKRVAEYAARLAATGLEATVSWALTAANREVRSTLQQLSAAAAEIHTAAPADNNACALGAGSRTHINTPQALEELARLVIELSAKYPGDPGILMAILLNQVRLKHGEALWLPPGTPHAYLQGYGKRGLPTRIVRFFNSHASQ